MTQDLQALQAGLELMAIQAKRALQDLPAKPAIPGSRELRVTLAILERTVQLVRQAILGYLGPQELQEALELQVERAILEIQEKPGRQAFLATLEILVKLVKQARQA